MNGADSVVQTMMSSGIDVCFANPGTSEMALVAALDRTPGMRCVLGLFEGVVTGAADGYARMAEKPGATLLHCGPGLANGLANLHNAKRAKSSIVNVVGDHATYHKAFNAPLTADVEATARPYSNWVRTASSALSIGDDTARAIEAASGHPGQVATLVVPADVAWTSGASVRHIAPTPAPKSAPDAAIDRVVSILKSDEPTALVLGGGATLEAGLLHAEKVAKASNAHLLGQVFNPRISRGPQLPHLTPIPYPIDQGLAALSKYRHIILVGADLPVAFFAYPGRPSSLVAKDCEVTVLAQESENVVAALEAVAEAFAVTPQISNKPKPTPATGPLTPDAIAQSVGALMPEGAIVADETLTSGRNALALTRNAAPHDWLQLTGGSIGIGIPLATGAATACPNRRVVCLQADGSAMYTLQGLWTQAREKLNVTTVIYANNAYAILRQELKNLGFDNPGQTACDMIDLGRPNLNWVQLANGMGVDARRVTTTEEFNDVFRASRDTDGPFLIEAAIV
ncbi:MAG: acetolactate synthase large subunit [Hyphomicrobiaceae bacterium]